jgi:hypothetical protein
MNCINHVGIVETPTTERLISLGLTTHQQRHRPCDSYLKNGNNILFTKYTWQYAQGLGASEKIK